MSQSVWREVPSRGVLFKTIVLTCDYETGNVVMKDLTPKSTAEQIATSHDSGDSGVPRSVILTVQGTPQPPTTGQGVPEQSPPQQLTDVMVDLPLSFCQLIDPTGAAQQLDHPELSLAAEEERQEALINMAHLTPEQLENMECVLQTEEAKQMLTEPIQKQLFSNIQRLLNMTADLEGEGVGGAATSGAQHEANRTSTSAVTAVSAAPHHDHDYLFSHKKESLPPSPELPPNTVSFFEDGPTTAPPLQKIQPPRQSLGIGASRTTSSSAVMPSPPPGGHRQSVSPSESTHSEPSRRSARQQEKHDREIVEKIRAENQQMLAREREAMTSNEAPESPLEELQPAKTANPQSKRDRKPPKHLISEEFLVKPVSKVGRPRKRVGSGADAPSTEEEEGDSAAEDEVLPDEEEEEEEEEDDDEDDENFESDEDDPNKLWCICMQPHNNRFMICCDNCEWWFHGSCVGITKAQGKKMEISGDTWLCPKCRGVGNATQKAKAPSVAPAPSSQPVGGAKKSKPTPPAAAKQAPRRGKPKQRKHMAPVIQESEREKKKEPAAKRTCLGPECSKVAPEEAMYCSDACLLQYAKTCADGRMAHDTLLLIDKLSSKPQTFVCQTANLVHYLRAHPAYEVVTAQQRPPSQQSNASTTPSPTQRQPPHHLSSLAARRQSSLPGGRTAPLIIPAKPMPPSSPSPGKTALINSPGASMHGQKVKIIKVLPAKATKKEDPPPPKKPKPAPPPPSRKLSLGEKSSPASHRGGSGSAAGAGARGGSGGAAGGASAAAEETEEEKRQRQDKEEKNVMQKRECIRRFISHALRERCKGSEDMRDTSDETCGRIAKKIEHALFDFAGRDVHGKKYMNKYRVLAMSIKDKQNNELFRRIISGNLRPSKLVAMEAHEYADEAMRNQREMELKQELEKIKETELQREEIFLVKSHKGEIVYESEEGAMHKDTEVTLPDDLPDEDLGLPTGSGTDGESADAKKHTTSSSSGHRRHSSSKKRSHHSRPNRSRSPLRESPASGSSTPSAKDSTAEHKIHVFDRNCRICMKREPEPPSPSESSPKEPRKSKSHSSHHRRRNRSHSSSTSESPSQHRISHGGSHRHHSSRHRSKHHHKEKRQRMDSQSSLGEKEKEFMEAKTKELEEKILEKEDAIELEIEEVKKEHEMELRRESEQEKKVKEEISHVMEEVEEEIHSEDKLAAPASSLGEDPFGNPILWKGIIHSTEIAPPTFPVSASNLGGLCDYLTSDLPEKPERLTMVGKIEPDRVWKYIDKVRISKEIAILMLQTEAEHSTTYQELFDWMHSKRRYCVVQGHSSMVKDFYLVPIPKGSSGPTEMTNYLSLEGSRALSGSHEDVITGILVRYPRIRGTPPAVLAAPHAKPSTSQHRHGSSHRSHHHRHSNKREHHASSSSSSNGGSKLSPLPPAVTKIRDLPPPPTISAPSPVPPPPISNKPLPPPPISSKPLPVAPPLAPPPSVPLNVPVSSIPLPPDEEEIPSHQKMLLELNRQIEEEQSQLAKLRETAGDAAPYSPSMLDQEEISPIAVARDPIVEAYQRTTRKSAPADEDISLVDMDLDDQAPSSSATSSSAAVPAARTVAPSSTPSSSSTSSDVSVPSDPRRLRR